MNPLICGNILVTVAMGVSFGSEFSQIGTKWDKFGTLKNEFSVRFGSTGITDLKKVA